MELAAFYKSNLPAEMSGRVVALAAVNIAAAAAAVSALAAVLAFIAVKEKFATRFLVLQFQVGLNFASKLNLQ